jgi:hypothetical protein
VYEDDDDERVTLVIVTRSGDKRKAWVEAIREGKYYLVNTGDCDDDYNDNNGDSCR